MAPVIWGLPLEEIKWSKFKSSYMWQNRYHLRRTKFIVYQLAMIFSVIGESLGTAVMSDYLDEQKFATSTSINPNATIHNNDFVGAFSYNIFAGVFVAFIFGAAFFFDLFWPERHEDHGIKLAWKLSAIASSIFQLAAALTTTIILSNRSAHVEGVSRQEEALILAQYEKKSPLIYRHSGRGIASVVFGWLGFVFVVVSTYIMWKSYAHNDKYGPLAAHVRREEDVEAPREKSTPYNGYDGAAEAPLQEPVAAHTAAEPTSQSSLGAMVEKDQEADGYNVATASTLNGTKAPRL